jgi:peptidyl-prolyl cis-trans isomerase C
VMFFRLLRKHRNLGVTSVLALAAPLLAGGCGTNAAQPSATPTPIRISSTPHIIATPTAVPTYVVPVGTPIPSGALAARVNGNPIYLSDYQRLRALAMRRIWSELHIDPLSKQGRTLLQAQDRGYLERLIQAQIILPFAKTHNLIMSDAELTYAGTVLLGAPGQHLSKAEQQRQGQRALQRQLAIQDMTMGDYKDQILLQKVAGYVVSHHQYRGDEVYVRQIVVANPSDANAIRQKLVGGADFATLAGAKSIDPTSNTRGGVVGFVGRGQLPAGIDQVVFSIKPNTFSQPVHATDGYHIIEVTKVLQGAPLTGQALNSAELNYWVQWYSAQRKTAKIAIYVRFE